MTTMAVAEASICHGFEVLFLSGVHWVLPRGVPPPEDLDLPSLRSVAGFCKPLWRREHCVNALQTAFYNLGAVT